MKFARLGTPGAEIPVLLEGDRYLDLRPVTSDVNGDFLAGDFVARVAAARDAGELPSCRTPRRCASAPRSPARAR